jgi:hypothetical protein
MSFADRDGRTRQATIALAEDPHLEVAPIEAAGGALSPAQQSFRDAWLQPKR